MTAIKLAEMVVEILSKKAFIGSREKTWEGFQNGNADDIGDDIEAIIAYAKTIIQNNKTNER